MFRKTVFSVMLLVCVLLSGCSPSRETAPPETAPRQTLPETEITRIIRPLPDSTMECLADSVSPVSFGEGDLDRSDSGELLLRMQVYSYDKFDPADISLLQEGDILLTSDGEIAVLSVTVNELGTVFINGGLDEGGLELAADGNGTYCALGYSDMKSWYPAGEAVCTVSDSFVFTDRSDLDKEPAVFGIDDFLNGNPEIDYRYQPQSTTVRIENGQVMAMERIYTP